MVSHGNAAGNYSSFRSVIEEQYAASKGATVFVNSVPLRKEFKANVFRLIERHVKQNVVKIGEKHYRQKKGIPQGSVVSSLLCNLFYAQLESDRLGFIDKETSLLLRLLDDFLLITPSREQAERFLQTTHEGIAEYGVSVKLEKSMANFATTVDGRAVNMSKWKDKFPYCGVNIDTTTLDVIKDAERVGTRSTRTVHSTKYEARHSMADAKADIGDALTVDVTRMPGQTFHRKMLKWVFHEARFFVWQGLKLTRHDVQCVQDTAPGNVSRYDVQLAPHSAIEPVRQFLAGGASVRGLREEAVDAKSLGFQASHQ